MSQTLAVVLSGGGARAAYQVGVLAYIGRHFPDTRIAILTGISAGAINAAHLANHAGSLRHATDDLAALWQRLETDRVFAVAAVPTVLNMVRWGAKMISGRRARKLGHRSLLDASPLHGFLSEALATTDGSLPGIRQNLAAGRLKALAIVASSYSTGNSVTWVQGDEVDEWTRELRVGVRTTLTLNHIMASAAIPFLFPAVNVDQHWFGDGSVRLLAPLSPALRLGASRILAISTRHDAQARHEPTTPQDYPPTGQIAGALFNSIFMDGFEADTLKIKRVNQLIEAMDEHKRDGMRPVEVCLVRPSTDLGTIANRHEPKMPDGVHYLRRMLGQRDDRSNDMLSLLMFQPDYVNELIAIGEQDAAAMHDELAAIVADD